MVVLFSDLFCWRLEKKKRWRLCLVVVVDDDAWIFNGILLIDVVVFWRERCWDDELGECCWQVKRLNCAWLDDITLVRVSVNSPSNWFLSINGKHE